MENVKKTCTKCHIEKPLIKFKNSGKKSSICKLCRNQQQRFNHSENIERLYLYLIDHPCVDCGERDPRSLTFDHTGGYNKSQDISKMIGRYVWASIMVEMGKCEVRCANCHNKKTAKERNIYMHRIVQEFGY